MVGSGGGGLVGLTSSLQVLQRQAASFGRGFRSYSCSAAQVPKRLLIDELSKVCLRVTRRGEECASDCSNARGSCKSFTGNTILLV